MWLSGLSAGLRSKGSPVQFQFPVKAHAWVAGKVPSRGHTRGNHTDVALSPLSKNKVGFFFKFTNSWSLENSSSKTKEDLACFVFSNHEAVKILQICLFLMGSLGKSLEEN